jgi:penicillin amidase
MLMLRRTAQGRCRNCSARPRCRSTTCCGVSTSIAMPRASVAALEPETLAALEAYSDGVNAWIASWARRRWAGARRSCSCSSPRSRHGDRPIPWPVTLVMALQLAEHHEEEVLRARTSLRWAIPSGCRHDARCAGHGARRNWWTFAALFDAPLPRFAASTSGRAIRCTPIAGPSGAGGRRTSSPPRRRARPRAAQSWPMIRIWA